MIGGLSCLEVGPGDCPLEGGWDKMDVILPQGVNSGDVIHECVWIEGRLGYAPLPIPDCAYDLIFMSHVIEHIPWYQTADALKEIFRILKDGGDLEVWTIDFAVVVDAYLEKRWVRDWDCGGRVTKRMQSIAGHVYAYEKHGSQYMWHKALFDCEYLTDCLVEVGFKQVSRLTKSRGHDHGPANLGVRATK